jgi:hypothetical protein
MASVQELLLAAQAQRSPLESLLTGLASGFGKSQDNRLQNAQRLIAIEDAKEKRRRDKITFEQDQELRARRIETDERLRKTLFGDTENKNKADFKGATVQGKPAGGGPRLQRGIEVGPGGLLKETFKQVPPVSFQIKEYLDDQKRVRMGVFNPATGVLTKTPNDSFGSAGAQKDTGLSEKQIDEASEAVLVGDSFISKWKGRGQNAAANMIQLATLKKSRERGLNWTVGRSEANLARQLAAAKVKGGDVGAIGTVKRRETILASFSPVKAKVGLLRWAGLINAKADRALAIIHPPGGRVTAQRLTGALADIASIMKQGTPTDQDMKHQEYGTFMESFSRVLTKISGSPSGLVPDSIVQEVKSIIMEIKEVDNKIIRGEIAQAKITYREDFKQDSQFFKDSIARVESFMHSPFDEPAHGAGRTVIRQLKNGGTVKVREVSPGQWVEVKE